MKRFWPVVLFLALAVSGSAPTPNTVREQLVHYIKSEQERFRAEVREFKTQVRQDYSEVIPADCQIYSILLRNTTFTHLYKLPDSILRSLMLKHKKTMLERKKIYQDKLPEAPKDDEDFEIEDIDSFNSKGLSSFTDLWVGSFNISMRTTASYMRLADIAINNLPVDAFLNVGTSSLALALTIKSSKSFFKRKMAERALKHKMNRLNKRVGELAALIASFDLTKEPEGVRQALIDEKDEGELDLKVMKDSLAVKRTQLEGAARGLAIDGALSSSAFSTTVLVLSGASGLGAGLASSIVGGISYGAILAYVASQKIINDFDNLKIISEAKERLRDQYQLKFPLAEKDSPRGEVEQAEELAYKLKINNLDSFHKTVRMLNLSRSSFIMLLSGGIITSGAIGVAMAAGVTSLALAAAGTGYGIIGATFCSFAFVLASYAMEHYWGPRMAAFFKENILGKEMGQFSGSNYYQKTKVVGKLEKKYKKLIVKFEADVKSFAKAVAKGLTISEINQTLDTIYGITPAIHKIQMDMNRISIEIIPYRVYYQAMDWEHRQMVKALFRKVEAMPHELYDLLLDRLQLDKRWVEENPFGLSKKQMLDYMVGVWILSHYGA